MSGMDHFAIANSEDNSKFRNLILMAENLDKEDFLDSSYYVNESLHLTKGSRDVSTSGRAGQVQEKEKRKSKPHL